MKFISINSICLKQNFSLCVNSYIFYLHCAFNVSYSLITASQSRKLTPSSYMEIYLGTMRTEMFDNKLVSQAEKNNETP